MTAVRILGREYRVRNAGDSERLQVVAGYVDRLMREMQVHTPDTQEVAILAALNLASELLLCQERLNVSPDRIRALIDLVDSV